MNGKPWTQEEIDFAFSNKETLQYEQIAAHLGRSYHSVYLYFRRMGVKKKRVNKAFSSKSNRRFFSDAEFKELERLAPGMNVHELAAHFKLSPRNMRLRLDRLRRRTGVTCKALVEKENSEERKFFVPWTEEEDARLRELAPQHDDLELSQLLKRTRHAIMQRRRNLGIANKMTNVRKRWTEKERYKVMFGCENKNATLLAKELNRTPRGVRWLMEKEQYTPFCNAHSLRSASESTGYSEYQLRRAKKALRQNWRKAVFGNGGRQRFVISKGQLEVLCGYLKVEGTPEAQKFIEDYAGGRYALSESDVEEAA